MLSREDLPADAYWVEVDGDGRIHPYVVYRMVNRSDIEVVDSVTTDGNSLRRYVLLRDGEYEVWVVQRHNQEYGYALRDDEQVSKAEREAITLKQRAIRDGSSVTLEEVLSYAEHDDPAVLSHALIAGYYAVKASSDVPDNALDDLRERVREVTSNVDLDHTPTVKKILRKNY